MRALQLQLHIHRTRYWISPVLSDFFESQLAVHCDRIFHHRFDSVKAHAPIANLAGFFDDVLSYRVAQPFAAKPASQIQPLHLADSKIQLVKRDASYKFPFVFYKQQAAVGRSVLSRKLGEFLIEILKTKTEAEGLGVLKE